MWSESGVACGVVECSIVGNHICRSQYENTDAVLEIKFPCAENPELSKIISLSSLELVCM